MNDTADDELSDEELDLFIEGCRLDLLEFSDEPIVAGTLGEALAERYRRQPNEQDLTDALSTLHIALNGEADAVDTARWMCLVSFLYAERADENGTAADWDRAVSWLCRATDSAPAEYRDDLLVDRALLLMRRQHSLTWQVDPESRLAQAQTLVADVSGIAARIEPGECQDMAHALHGLALLARSRASEDPDGCDDRERAIEILTATLPKLPTATPFLVAAHHELAEAAVALPACTTNVTGLDYDEAFSLSTAFLAAGARTVFGSLWKAGDIETTLLMFMLHHHLSTGARPADALRQAQQWMLDTDRVVPDTMPADLARHARPDPLVDPAFWACRPPGSMTGAMRSNTRTRVPVSAATGRTG